MNRFSRLAILVTKPGMLQKEAEIWDAIDLKVGGKRVRGSVVKENAKTTWVQLADGHIVIRDNARDIPADSRRTTQAMVTTSKDPNWRYATKQDLAVLSKDPDWIKYQTHALANKEPTVPGRKLNSAIANMEGKSDFNKKPELAENAMEMPNKPQAGSRPRVPEGTFDFTNRHNVNLKGMPRSGIISSSSYNESMLSNMLNKLKGIFTGAARNTSAAPVVPVVNLPPVKHRVKKLSEALAPKEISGIPEGAEGRDPGRTLPSEEIGSPEGPESPNIAREGAKLGETGELGKVVPEASKAGLLRNLWNTYKALPLTGKFAVPVLAAGGAAAAGVAGLGYFNRPKDVSQFPSVDEDNGEDTSKLQEMLRKYKGMF